MSTKGNMETSHESSPVISIHILLHVDDPVCLNLLAGERTEVSFTSSTPDVLDKVNNKYLSLEGQPFHKFPYSFPGCRHIPEDQQWKSNLPHFSDNPYNTEDPSAGGCLPCVEQSCCLIH